MHTNGDARENPVLPGGVERYKTNSSVKLLIYIGFDFCFFSVQLSKSLDL
jgi:hypothetical protein